MLMVTIYIATVLFVLSALFYLRRFWYLKGVKDIKGEFPWPIIMNAFNLRTPEKMMEYLLYIPKKYNNKPKGYTFSIGFDSYICVIDSELVCAAMNSQELITKSNDYKCLKPWLGLGLLLSTGKKWTQRRKLLTSSFHFSILRDFVTTFEAIGDILIETLGNKANGNPVEVSELISLYSLDVICETSLGISIDAQRNENQEYITAVRKIAELSIKRGTSWWKRFDFLYKYSWEYNAMVSLCTWVHKFTFNIIDRRREAQSDFDDDLIDGSGAKKKFALLDILIKSTIGGMPLSNEDIREEVDTFMFEGHDTTASALSFAIYCLSQHPEIQERLLREQTEILGDAVHATYDDLNKMGYLNMVIKEVLRLFPPVPVFSRVSEKDVPMEIGTIKPGAVVGMSPMLTQRHPKYFSDPEKFDPERFSPENINNIKPFSYIPFSGGYRNCIGQKFAMLTLKSAISKIVRNFKIHPDLTYKPILAFEVTLKTKNGIWIIIEKRL